MKTQIKTTLYSAIIVSVGLYSATPFAAPEVSSTSERYTTSNSYVSSTSINYNYAYPSITSEIFEKNSLLTIAQAADQPFLSIKAVDYSLLTPNKAQRKNSIFEFAAKFNDKLQQILTFFSFSENSNVSQVEEDFTVERDLLQVQIKQTKSSNNLQSNCRAAKA